MLKLLKICEFYYKDCKQVEEKEGSGSVKETWALSRIVPETGGLMEIQKNLGSAFILNDRHLALLEKELADLEKTPSSDRWDSELRRVCTCFFFFLSLWTGADIVSVLILKASSLSVRRSVKWEYTHFFKRTHKWLQISQTPQSN